jgi:hypothetical protein
MRTQLPLALIAAAFACSLFTAPAHAQRARVFVASYGVDASNTTCSFTQPCRTFQHALGFVLASGEVTAIDSAGFSPVTITQSVTITSPAGVEAGIAANSGGAAVIINAPNAAVSLHGLTLEGGGTGGLYGIEVFNAAKVDIVDCVIRDYQAGGSSGVGIMVNANAPLKVAISNTSISNNDSAAVMQSGAGAVAVTLDHVTMTDNTDGIEFLPAGSAAITAMIANSNISHTANWGIYTGSGTGLANVSLFYDNFNDNNNAVYLQSNSNLYLSHVNDAHSSNSGIFFASTMGVTAYSDGTSHLTSFGGSLTSWSPQ